MRILKIIVMTVVVLSLVTGSLFAQSQGRVEWYARARTDIQFNFSPMEEDENGQAITRPGIAFSEDDDGGAYSWDTNAELLVWYGKELTSMWGIISYRQGWGFETKFNLSYDNDRTGNMGGKVQTGSRWSSGTDGSGFNLFELNRISTYGWWQAWNRRILMEMNPFGATEEEWGSAWRTPLNIFDDEEEAGGRQILSRDELAFFDHNIDAFFRLQVRNWVDNLNFGFALPNFGRLTALQWGYNTKMVDGEPHYWEAHDVFLRTSFGFTYNDFDWGIAGGFKLDPEKAQRAYLGGEYKLLNQRLRVGADFKWNNIGAMDEDGSDLDIAQMIIFNDGPLNLRLELGQLNLFYNDNSEFLLRVKAQCSYVIIGRRLLGRMRFYYYRGLGEDFKNYSMFEIEPGIFWSLGPHGVSDSLDSYTGMFARFNYQFGTSVLNTDIDERKLIVGFRWAK